MKKYSLRYLPIAQQDLSEIIDYIQNNLQNPIAALTLAIILFGMLLLMTLWKFVEFCILIGMKRI